MAALSAVSVAITLSFATNSSAPQGRSLDWPGQITIAVSLFALLYGVIQGADDGWGSATVVGGFVVAVVFMAFFVAIQRRVDRPLIRLELFSNRAFTVTAVVTVIGMSPTSERPTRPASGSRRFRTTPRSRPRSASSA